MNQELISGEGRKRFGVALSFPGERRGFVANDVCKEAVG